MSTQVIKLSNGEDIVCRVHKSKNSIETNKLKVSSPLKMDTVTKETDRGFVDSLALTRWIQPYSDENVFDIERQSIVIMTPASVGLSRYYEYVLDNLGQSKLQKIVPTKKNLDKRFGKFLDIKCRDCNEILKCHNCEKANDNDPI